MTVKPNAESLLAAGYKEYTPPSFEKYSRLFQKRVSDLEGTLFFVNFREWRMQDDTVTFDADLSCQTATGGTIWVTMREDTILQTERLATAIWMSAGCVYYERG